MMGKFSRKISEALRGDDFKQISDYIVESCNLLSVDYQHQRKQMPNHENKIRNILLEEYLDVDNHRTVFGMGDYRFFPETQEHYNGQGNYIGRADIRVMLKTDFEKRNAYYLVECKRLDGSDNLNKKYVGEGIARFVSQKYSAYYGKGIMLGFVVRQINISENVQEIEDLQNENADPNMHGKFEKLNRTSQEIYNCDYQLQEGTLKLRHIFVDFSRVVQ